ncbi:MAG: bifunctional hydroxymethylpyrimidine kinase/phosphomethylpyrimidine kinase [Deltaproteobacteria bacterium]|nr:bifunctional hydroxymethylpyrimidine kinase/phosphomethylpyrimidine kinase [Deltaproteobacteria bacterium]
MKYILTIAGSDSCGGAGIQADIKAITGLGCHALTAITAVTAQNSRGVSGIHEIPSEFIAMQIETVARDILPDAVKIGMLSSAPVIETVAGIIKTHGLKNIVLDPVMKASTGRDLIQASSISLLKEMLLPLADVITPNLDEAEILAGGRVKTPADMERAALELKKMGPLVVITGGHLAGNCMDLLYDGRDFHRFHGERIVTETTHGTGCVFSSSLACFLAMGNNIVDATGLAHEFTRRAIENGYSCGKGPGTVSPFN